MKTKTIITSILLTLSLSACATSAEPKDTTNSQYYSIESKAVSEVTSIFNNGSSSEQNLEIFADPKIDKSLIEEQVQSINSQSKLLTGFSPNKVTLLYWVNSTPEQINWAQGVFNKVKGNIMPNAKITDNTQSGCSNAGASDFKQGSSHNYFISVCAGINTTADFRIMHEYYHIYQYSNNVPGSAPTWVTEGSADMIGQILGLRMKDNLLFVRHKKDLMDVSNGTGLTMTYNTLSQEDFIKIMNEQESSNGNPRISYYLGSLATEYLIGKFGYSKWDNFIKSYAGSSIENGGDVYKKKFFVEKFTSNFGISPNQFYVELYPYFKAMTEKYSSL